jgi:protease-4
MQYSQFFSEVYESVISITDSGLMKYEPYLQAHRDGKIMDFPELPQIKMGLFDSVSRKLNTKDQDNIPENSVAVIPLKGVLTSSGSWWDHGTTDIANMLMDCFNNDNITSVVIDTDSIGGSWKSLFPWKEAFAKKNKPVYGAVRAKALSAGYYPLTFCDKIFACHEMAEIGSIGVMSTTTNNDEMYKKYGITRHVIIPPESKYKNEPELKAKEGDGKMLIKLQLSPMANFYQETVKKNRKKLNEDVEGIIEGRVFFANYTEDTAIRGGLIDGVRSFSEILEYAADHKDRTIIEKL